LKKAKYPEKSQIEDKYTTTPLKHPNAFLKGKIYKYIKRVNITPLTSISKVLVLLKSNTKP